MRSRLRWSYWIDAADILFNMKAALAARGISADRALVTPAPGLLFAGDVDLGALVLKPAVPAWPNTTAPPVALVRDYNGAPGVYTGGGEVTGRAFVLLDVERVAAQRAGMLQLLAARGGRVMSRIDLLHEWFVPSRGGAYAILGGGVVARPWRKEDVAAGCRAKVWLWDRTAPRDAGCPLGRCRTQGQIEGLHKPPAIDGCAARAHAILRAEHVALAGRLDLAL